MTTPRSPAGSRCRTCTNAAGPSASGSRSPPSPGKDSAPVKTSGTGSRPPPTAGAGGWTPRIRTPCPGRAGQGRGGGKHERYRIAAPADGGIWVLNPPYPDPLTGLAGTRRVLETAHKLIGATWGDEGTTREQRAWVADPELIRRLEVGQACYIHRGAASFVQVARPKASPLTLLPASGPAGAPTRVPVPRRESAAEPVLARLDLDDVFGPGAAL